MTQNITGLRMKAARKAMGLSHDEVAKHFNVSRTSVSNWETGKNLPECDKMSYIANLYGVSVDYLLDAGPGPNEEIEALIDIYRRTPASLRQAMLRSLRSFVEPYEAESS